ncbi:MAG: hypothetical protein COV99_01600 [Bacteroidetes bacterium CG12_big_fil_rev_8_21_14_0_65_60_17]|nr:MAG: hypothetical protein COV99_01600 [Bacteroidetes bacterium CG12_big_fil_rev_8_21_14_0_65_60_17]
MDGTPEYLSFFTTIPYYFGVFILRRSPLTVDTHLAPSQRVAPEMAFLFVVRRSGEILRRMTLPYFAPHALTNAISDCYSGLRRSVNTP